jgi:hypothetical protein
MIGFYKRDKKCLLCGTDWCFKYSSLPFILQRCRAAAIQGRVTAVLRSIPKEAFADSFQKLYERC